MRRAVALGILALAVLAPAASAAPGDPDYSFGQGGRTLIGQGWEGNAVAVQPDGKIVVAGGAFVGDQDQFLVLRLNANGRPDPSFAGDGSQIVDFGPGTFSRARDVALGPGGKIVVAGQGGGGGGNMAVARLNPDGSPDTSFSGDGRVVFTSEFPSDASGVAVQPDGRVVVGGEFSSDEFAETRGWLLVRLTAAGVPDPGFGTGGVMAGDAFGDETILDVALMPDGRVVTAGSCCFPTYVELRLRRFAQNGVQDEPFANQVEALGLFAVGEALTLLPGGRMLVGGSFREPEQLPNLGENQMAVARFLQSGALDGSFAQGGIQYITDFNGLPAAGLGMGTDAANRIAIGGSTAGLVGGGSSFVAARVLPDGGLDASFGRGGKVVTRVSREDVGGAVAVQADGKVVTAGTSVSGPEEFFTVAVLRYLGSGSNGPGNGPPVECPQGVDESVRCFDSSASAPRRCAGKGLPRKRRRYPLTMIGGRRRENISGTPAADLIMGGGGSDQILAGGGADCLLGGGGADYLAGAGGGDFIAGGRGGDSLFGGRGKDSFAAGPGRDSVDARGGRRERVSCGPGRDSVQTRRRERDRVKRDCRP